MQWDGACDAMIYLARETEMSLTVLNAELASLSPAYVRVLNFTTMITQPSKYSQLISSFLNFGATAATQLQTAMVDKFLG